MKSEQERQKVAIQYEKPTAVDLGPSAPVVGASCVTGRFIGSGGCGLVGNTAIQNCSNLGNSAAESCDRVGSAAVLSCASTGSSAGTNCYTGDAF